MPPAPPAVRVSPAAQPLPPDASALRLPGAFPPLAPSALGLGHLALAVSIPPLHTVSFLPLAVGLSALPPLPLLVPPGALAFCSLPKASSPGPGASALPGVSSRLLRPSVVCTWPQGLASILLGASSLPRSPVALAPLQAKSACLLQGVRSGPGTADTEGHPVLLADPNVGKEDRISLLLLHRQPLLILFTV